VPARAPGQNRNGQLLVELAISLPILMLLFLGAVEAGFLLIEKAKQDRSTAVVADWAAMRPGESWNTVANRELPGCDVTVSRDPDLVEVGATCRYQPVVWGAFWDGLPISSQESAATAKKGNGPSPSDGP
jgi:hypothetical protein